MTAYEFALPHGFIPIPLDAEPAALDLGVVARALASLLGLPAEHVGAAAAAARLCDFGGVAGAAGCNYAAIGLFRKVGTNGPEAAMVLMTSIVMESSHPDRQTAVAGLRELHEQGGTFAQTLELPVGPAVAVISERTDSVSFGADTVEALNRQITTWIPDPTGSTVVALSVSCSSQTFWAEVCAIALDVVETVRWSHAAVA